MGLREEKKLKLRHDIERATLKLVIKRGYDAATVEDICKEAGVASNKTFFNHFPGKSAALTGHTLHFPSANELLKALEERADESYFDIVAELLAERVTPVSDDAEVAKLRRKAFRKNPQLLFLVDEGLHEIEHAISNAVEALLTTHPERSLAPGVSESDVPGALDPSREAFVAATCAMNVARVCAMLAVTGGDGISTAEVRRLVSGYLAAGLDGEGGKGGTASEGGASGKTAGEGAGKGSGEVADWAKPLVW